MSGLALENYIKQIEPADNEMILKSRARWDKIAKPIHGLGLLEDAVSKIAGISRDITAPVDKKALVIMCADNGIVEEGVTQTGQEVTAVVTENMTNGLSCACIMAEQCGCDVFPVDIGVAGELNNTGLKYPLISCKIARGTKNFIKEHAMTEDETIEAILSGIRIAGELKEKGFRLIATGEMGIGNTTTSSAVASALLGCDAEAVTGKGSGLTDEGLKRKIDLIQRACEKWKPDKDNPIDVLKKVGGFDIAGLAGIFLGGAVYRIPVLMDGFISGVSALAAVRLCPEASNYILASHSSREPGNREVLNELGLTPVIFGDFCLGEGSGAVSIMPMLDMAVTVYNRMSTFNDINIEEYKPL